MKAKELLAKTNEELNRDLLDVRRAQFGLRVQLATQQVQNTSQLGKLRRDVARIKTVLHQKAAAK